MKLLILAGTRPEAIKVAPVALAMRGCPGWETVLCSSGQHREMLEQAFSDFDLRPERSLQVMRPGQTLASLSAALFSAVDELLNQEKPDWVLVQGDTTTVMVASLCAFYRKIRVAHLEAGLRSFNMYAPFPEELNRRVAGMVADMHFAPTEGARDNLVREGLPESRVLVTGNTVIDALLLMRDRVRNRPDLLSPALRDALDRGKRMVLITGHRRENFGKGFSDICRAIQSLADSYDDVVFVYPVHLNPEVQKPVLASLGNHANIILLDPLPYASFIAHLDAAYCVLTDSGGVQEEAPSLGRPVLVMREVTERPEGVAAGACRLVGAESGAIRQAVRELLDSPSAYQKMSGAGNPYGDGKAALRIRAFFEGIVRPGGGPDM